MRRAVSIIRTLFMPAAALTAALATTMALAEFRQINDNVAIGYEGPSAKATRQFLYGRGTPLEVVVQIEGWVKVRDAQGTLAWVEKKALAERNTVLVKVPVADVYAAPDAASPIVFRADNGVMLQLVAQQPAGTLGAWAQVRHRDGQSGYVRLDAVFGL
mgnify:CR=1 FL=1